ncbi:MAG: NUDIX domain-containing protein [Nocardioides sp.]
MTGWQTHGSRTAYENAWIRVREDRVTGPDGRPGVYGVVEMRHDSVFVVAVTEADEVVLVDLVRYATGGGSVEVPAGGTDGEDPLDAARRELREEAGLEAATWTPLTAMWALNGVCRAREHVFLARGLREVAGEARAEEGITAVRRVPWPEVLRMVREGEISDAESMAALLCAALELGKVG